MHQITKRIVTISILLGFFAGLLGGALTNEYLIAYLFDLVGGKVDERSPIVKRIVEEKVYIEDSKLIDVVEDASASVVSLKGQKFAKTAVIVTTDGLLMTGKNDIKLSYNYTAHFPDSKEYFAKAVYIDPKFDVAILKINKEKLNDSGELNNLHVLEFADSSEMKLGQSLVILDYAGESLSVGQAILSQISGENVFKVDGSSLSGLVANIDGQLIGINDGAEGISSDRLNEVLDSYLKTLK